MKSLRQLIALGLAAAALILVFAQFGGFTLSASILLGICFSIVGLWMYATYQVAAFKPYTLQIFINFEALREDLGMVKDSEPVGSNRPSHELFNFTAISAALFVHYREYVSQTAEELHLEENAARSRDEYRSAIRFGNTIPGHLKFSTKWADPKTSLFWFPRFTFGYGSEGFELRVQVVTEWWSEYKKQLGSEVRNLPVSWDGFIVLAQLPYGYLPDHVRRYDERMSVFYPFDKIHGRWRAKLAKHGWTVTEDGKEISSRYIIVRYQGIWPV